MSNDIESLSHTKIINLIKSLYDYYNNFISYSKI